MCDGQSEEPQARGKLIGLDRRELLLDHANGDKEAFAELMSIYRAPVYTYLVRLGIEGAARDDLFQEVFIKIHCAASAYDPAFALVPWIYTIVANTARSFYRKERIRGLSGESIEMEASQEPASDEKLAARETALWLQAALKKLPFDQREVLLLCSTGSLQQEDVGKILNMPHNTVKTNLRRARMSLAKALMQRNARISSEAAR